MPAVVEAEYLDVIHGDGAAGGRDAACRAVQDAMVGPGEGALPYGDIAGDVTG